MSTPILKVGQALTKEVTEGDAVAGEFINTLTSEGLGTTVEFVNAYYNRGRFASDRETNRAFVAYESTIPDHWADLLGEKYVGTPFSEHPDAEEEFKRACNAKERDWGKGPLISTTHNFTGLVLVETGEEDEPISLQPARLSLKRTDVPAAKKILTLQRLTLRGKPPWDIVLRLSTIRKASGEYSSFVINPSDLKKVRDTTSEEKELASQLALAAAQGRVKSVGDDTDVATAPASRGGLDVA